MSTTLIERLEAIIATGEVSRSGLARAAGLHPNSLRKLGSDDWNPTADTLTRLEKLIHSGTDVLVGPEAIIDEARNGRMLLPLSFALNEQVIPDDWTFVFILALSSQVLGQSLLVYAIGSLPPIVVGLTLLTQPAISAMVGWIAYGEILSPLDWIGAFAIAGALVLVRLPERGLRRRAPQPS